MISPNELEDEVSKIKDKLAEEFGNFIDFSEESIKAWIIDYVNFNNIISIMVNEA